ncbi:hypothetical protein [Actinoplanes sp. N902-109]|uniref:hypothetical protein n=1 Tax=Actinoplanes sp. (strain N902-109) TaxID=649831 RepID=UPI0003294538|nr:hypothetical protein [Actinoplanes sp. N902-109]AGL19516.1 hypothetical protein L083_6006 [Actinoplanes sp. N902-109]
MTQPQLVGIPRRRREIWASMCSGRDEVIDADWRAAIAEHQPVGTCGKVTGRMACGQPLRPGMPYKVGGVTWYPAECPQGHETAAHGARPVKPKKKPPDD